MEVSRNTKGRTVKCLEVAIGRPRTISKGKTVTLAVRIPEDLATDLDAEAELENSTRSAGPKGLDRSDIVRMALHQWVQERKAARGE